MLPEPIKKRLEKLDVAIKKLEEIGSCSLDDFLVDWKLQDIALRNIQVSVECCLDIGTYILSKLGKEIPDTYVGIIEKLSDYSIIDKELSSFLKDYVKLRNIIVHEYLSIDFQKIYNFLKNLHIFKKYSQSILSYFSKQG